MPRSKLFLLLLFLSIGARSQQLITGTVTSSGKPVAGITVMNLVTEQVVATDESGKFAIPVKEDELLIFSSVNYEYKRKLVEASDLESGQISIVLVPKVTKLEEVVVYQDIMPEQLGIPAGKKKYTPAERRWKAGGEFTPTIFLIPVPVIIVPIDPIINAITGKRGELRKNIEVERKQRLLEKLRSKFEAEYICKRYKIASERVEGFYFFLLEDPDFASALEQNNKTRMEFIMAEQSIAFNKLEEK